MLRLFSSHPENQLACLLQVFLSNHDARKPWLQVGLAMSGKEPLNTEIFVTTGIAILSWADLTEQKSEETTSNCLCQHFSYHFF